MTWRGRLLMLAAFLMSMSALCGVESGDTAGIYTEAMSQLRDLGAGARYRHESRSHQSMVDGQKSLRSVIYRLVISGSGGDSDDRTEITIGGDGRVEEWHFQGGRVVSKRQGSTYAPRFLIALENVYQRQVRGKLPAGRYVSDMTDSTWFLFVRTVPSTENRSFVCLVDDLAAGESVDQLRTMRCLLEGAAIAVLWDGGDSNEGSVPEPEKGTQKVEEQQKQDPQKSGGAKQKERKDSS